MEGDLRRLRSLLTLLRSQGVTTFEGLGVKLELAPAFVPAQPKRRSEVFTPEAPEKPTVMSGPYGELERELWPNGAPFAPREGA